MNKLPPVKRAQVVAALVEGNSIRATVRMTGVAKNTVTKLLVDLGRVCDAYQRKALVGLRSRRIQCDEIWSFVYAKEKNAPEALKAQGRAGDVWTWTALDADSKLMVSWLVGGRDAGYAQVFMEDVASRLASRVQLTTDGHKPYLEAVEGAFGMDVDFAQLVKLYGEAPDGARRYSPAQCIGCKRTAITGRPDPAHVSTSYVERQNLTMRMGMRRFTRLTNAFSKKVENLEAAVALHFMYYNFARTPPVAPRDPGHGSGRVRSRLDAGRNCCPTRLARGVYSHATQGGEKWLSFLRGIHRVRRTARSTTTATYAQKGTTSRPSTESLGRTADRAAKTVRSASASSSDNQAGSLSLTLKAYQFRLPESQFPLWADRLAAC